MRRFPDPVFIQQQTLLLVSSVINMCCLGIRRRVLMLFYKIRWLPLIPRCDPSDLLHPTGCSFRMRIMSRSRTNGGEEKTTTFLFKEVFVNQKRGGKKKMQFLLLQLVVFCLSWHCCSGEVHIKQINTCSFVLNCSYKRSRGLGTVVCK